MDPKIEGYLIAAMALIPTGIGLVQAPDIPTKVIGVAMVGLGLLAVYLRGQQKDKAEQV